MITNFNYKPAKQLLCFLYEFDFFCLFSAEGPSESSRPRDTDEFMIEPFLAITIPVIITIVVAIVIVCCILKRRRQRQSDWLFYESIVVVTIKSNRGNKLSYHIFIINRKRYFDLSIT